MRKLSLLLLLIPCCHAAGAIQNPAAREGLSLNGAWRAVVDPYETGYFDYRHRPLGDRSMGENRKPASPAEFVEYDFDTSPQLQVPGDWNTQRPELMLYEGTVWYKRDFDYAVKPGRRLFAWFGAANYKAVAYLNGRKLGEHAGGFTPFQFEVTGLVREKGNFLIVKVDDRREKDAVPTMVTDWWNYGGLTRGVRIIDVPETFIEDYSLQLAKGSAKHVSGWVRLNGAKAARAVSVRIPKAGVAVTVQADTSGYAPVEFDAEFERWSPENPRLYDVTVETEGDRVADRIGFRTIETSGNQMLLNGKPLRLRGISIHAEAPFRAGRVANEAENRTLLRWAQELGCNFVRLPHYPQDESMVRLADEMGLLVWEEIPVYWMIEFENPEVLRNASRQLDETIARDRNRASVIIWSVGNETPPGPARLKFLAALADRAHEFDRTRLVTAAMETHRIDRTTVMVDDPLGEHLDLVSCNEYIGWYDGPRAKIDTTSWKTTYQKPFVLSEFGAEALAGRHGDPEAVWNEENQADFYKRQVAMFKRIPFLNGTIAWVLVDFRSPRRLLPGIQDYYNRKGLLSNYGEKKEAFFVLRDYYRSLEAADSAGAPRQALRP